MSVLDRLEKAELSQIWRFRPAFKKWNLLKKNIHISLKIMMKAKQLCMRGKKIYNALALFFAPI